MYTWGACLEDVFPFVVLGSLLDWDKLLKTSTTLGLTDKAFGDLGGKMGAREEGERPILGRALLQRYPEPEGRRWVGVLLYINIISFTPFDNVTYQECPARHSNQEHYEEL